MTILIDFDNHFVKTKSILVNTLNPHQVIKFAETKDVEIFKELKRTAALKIANDLVSTIKMFQNSNSIQNVIIANDSKGKCWRNEFLPTYKQNRAEKKEKEKQNRTEQGNLIQDAINEICKEAKKSSILIIKKMLEEYHIKTVSLSCEGLEADDIIAIATESLSEFNRYQTILIISSDKDFQQLVKNNVHLFSSLSDNRKLFFDTECRVNIETPLNTKKTISIQKIDLYENAVIKALNNNEVLRLMKIVNGDDGDNVEGVFQGIGWETFNLTEKRLEKLNIQTFPDSNSQIKAFLQDFLNVHFQKKIKEMEDEELKRLIATLSQRFKLNRRLMMLEMVFMPEEGVEAVFESLSENDIF